MSGTCADCRWAATVNDSEGLVCIRFPPAYAGPGNVRGRWTGFPPIRPEWTCGEFDPLEPASLSPEEDQG